MRTTVTAKLKYLHIPPRKVRFIVDVIRGLSVNEAEAQLYVAPRRPAVPVLKLLRSAIANGKQVLKKEPSHLFIKEIRVDQGPRTKRYTPRARGSASLIEKKMSHVTIVLGILEKEKDVRYTFRPKPKKEEKPKERKQKAKTDEKETEKKIRGGKGDIKSGAKDTGFRRMFQRKSV